jgi:hypothetical protein
MTARVMFANDIPFTECDLDPLKALGDAIAFAVDDWGASRSMAWVYGIVLGWDDDDPMEGESGHEAMDQLAARFRWTPEQVERLRELHRRFQALAEPIDT